MCHNQYGTRLYVVRRHAVSYQCSHWLYGVQIGSRLLGDGSTGGALCQNWVQRGQSRFVWPDELALGIAGSCGESLWSIIYTVDMVIDTAWVTSVCTVLCMSKGRVFILDVFAWLNICVPMCSTCRCIDMLAKHPEVSQPAPTQQSSTGSHISCLKGNSETMGCAFSSLLIYFEHITSCTSA